MEKRGKVKLIVGLPFVFILFVSFVSVAKALQVEVTGGEVRIPGGTNSNNWQTHFNYFSDGKNYIRGTTILADNGRNVGIGTTTPLEKLEVAGNVGISGQLKVGNLPNTGTTPVCVTTGPPPYRYTFGSCSSSEQYKNNIKNLNIGLETVKKLRPVSFNWKASGDADVGLIAEEVYKVNPNLVTYDKDGKLIGVKYDQLSAILINGMQEQQKEIELLKIKIAALESKITK